MKNLITILCLCLFWIGCSTQTLEPSIIEKSDDNEDYLGYLKKVTYVDSVRKTNSIPLIFTSVSTIGPNSTGGHKPKIGYEIFSEKDIKYLKINIQFYNRVLDRVYDKISSLDKQTLSMTGPIKKGEKSTETLFELVYNSDIHCMKINWVRIEYMDGSFDLFENKDVFKLLVPYDLMYFFGIEELNLYGRYTREGCCNYKDID